MANDQVKWKVQTRLDKFDVAAYRAAEAAGSTATPYEVVEKEGNLLMYGGADVLWLGLRDGLSASSGLANTKFNNGNAGIAVGNSSAASAATQTDIQASTGASNRYTKGMDATYPTHTTGTAASTASKILFKATFSSSQANFAWKEWAIKNKVSQAAGAGRMLNRAVSAQGTKVSSAVWAFTVTLSLA